MQRGVCKVVLVGNAGEDGLLKFTPAGKAVLRFSLATEVSHHSGPKPSMTPHNIVVAGPHAADHANAVFKGSLCYVEGTLRTRTDQTAGASRRITEVVVGVDGTLRVYHDAPPVERTAPQTQASANSQSQTILHPRDRDSVLASDSTSRSGKPASFAPDDEWLSFEGLTLNDHPDIHE